MSTPNNIEDTPKFSEPIHRLMQLQTIHEAAIKNNMPPDRLIKEFDYPMAEIYKELGAHDKAAKVLNRAVLHLNPPASDN